MQKIITILGARPQFIKAAPLSLQFARQSRFQELILHTGQHYDHQMSDVFFEELDIPRPHFRIESGSASHGRQTAMILTGVEEVLMQERPAAVIVFGDTNSTLAGALAAAKLNIPLCHIEAGLRSFNKRMPEEVNRVLTDHASDILFCPTSAARQNLLNEGIDPKRIHLVGDIMFDASMLFAERAARTSTAMQRLALQPGKFILASIHRAENTDDLARLSAIIDALGRISATTPVVLPLHPRTRKILAENPGVARNEAGLKCIDPLSFFDMSLLEQKARLIVTDSGGVQKEAYFYKVPCLTLRDETEWTELVQSGWNTLHPPRTGDEIVRVLERLLASPPPGETPQFYGAGDSAARILEVLQRQIG